MIRKEIDTGLLLFHQHDHAQLAGELAAQIGNDLFAAPDARAVRGIGLHDTGWVDHDHRPTIDSQGRPLDVFDTPWPLALPIWSGSASRASEADQYAGLLVSLHSLSLSVFASGKAPMKHESWDMSDPQARFAVNQFQHEQIELQERLRGALGLRTDRPLKHGLAEGSSDPREAQLLFDFRMLQAMDRLSLDICCTELVAPRIEPVLARPGGERIDLNVKRQTHGHLTVAPWPFHVDEVSVAIPVRRLEATHFASNDALRAALNSAAVEQYDVRLSPAD